MLQNKLFTFFNLQTHGDLVTAAIELNAGHPIFEGHFPQQPVLPGVCMLQIVKEVVAVYSGKNIRLVKAGSMKFLSFVDPNRDELMQLEFKVADEAGQLTIDAQLLQSANVVFKFKGAFIGM
jgi:3-hydroxyacyl-[acyl-carrier-protein] dehydratase